MNNSILKISLIVLIAGLAVGAILTDIITHKNNEHRSLKSHISDFLDPEDQKSQNLYQKGEKTIIKLYTLGSKKSPARSGTGFKAYLGGPKIVTNKHVVEDQDIIIAETPEKTWIIESWQEHPTLDIAILDCQEGLEGEFMEVDTDYVVKPGQKVYTLGYPLGLGLAIHQGLVNSIDKAKIVFSAPLSEGASGSPLINQEGKVIGICDSYIPNAQNYNLATPTSIAFLTEKWTEKSSKPDPELKAYIKEISSIKNKVATKRREWIEISNKEPNWKPWVNKTMITRVPTDNAMEHAFLAFAAIEWPQLIRSQDIKYKQKEAELLENCTTNLREMWDIHKQNLRAATEIKPLEIPSSMLGLDETEKMVQSLESISENLNKFLASSTGNETKEEPTPELKELILSLGSFKAAENIYAKIGTP